MSIVIFTAFFPWSKNIASTSVHPYHVSATEIEYNAVQKRLETSCRIFTDDFETVLSGLYKVKADFSDKSLKQQMDSLVKKYIITHLAIRTNGRLLPLQLFGWELDKDAVYVYTTAAATGLDPKNIAVENTILYDLFTDQINIVHFIINSNRQTNKLAYPERKLSFSF